MGRVGLGREGVVSVLLRSLICHSCYALRARERVPLTENNGASSSSRSGLWMIGLALIAGLAAFWLISSSGEDTDSGDAKTAISQDSNARDELARPDGTSGGDAAGASATSRPSGGPADASEDSRSDSAAVALGVPRDRPAPQQRVVPQEELDKLRRGAPMPSEEELELLRRDPNEAMPADIRAAFESGANPDIPPEILEDFKNPYPKIPDEERAILFGNGRDAANP